MMAGRNMTNIMLSSSYKFSNSLQQQLLLLLFVLVTFAAFNVEQVLAVKRSYVVYLGGHSHNYDGPEVIVTTTTTTDDDVVDDLHRRSLILITTCSPLSWEGCSKEKAQDAILYSYQKDINGFAAILEEEVAAEVAKHPEVVSVFVSRGKGLHTTHSWNFMMLEKANGMVHPSSLWSKANFGKDVIIANLDTGVWPESKSFSDQGFVTIPSKWKGSCQNHTLVPCNKKLIGSSYFNKGYNQFREEELGMKPLNASLDTARDHEGHGSHTLSTTGGNFVEGANLFGFANGTAKGGSPKARVAAYKVCWPPVNETGGCFDNDILKAFDAAIHDGVDVISLSVGGDPAPYLEDGIAIGAFHAIKNNIVVVASAGNSGPQPGSVSNVAPWLITVAASTQDRGFQAVLLLPPININGHQHDHDEHYLKGASLSEALPKKDEFYPLVYAAHANAANASTDQAKLCMPGSLDRKKIEGKLLICVRGITARVDKGYEAALAGAAGMVLCNDEASGDELIADAHFLPALQITYEDSLQLFAYLNSTRDPKGYIQSLGTVIPTKPAPKIAAFSSRGPNTVNPEILKPDITAPGVDILAAFSQEVSPTDLPFDKRHSPFAIVSGTSMACPHVSGIVGLLKTLHPDWSAAAIRSALIITARTRANTRSPMLDSNENKEATPFHYGGGHVRPNRAEDPGLVYDLTVEDYLDWLCGIGYNQTIIQKINSDRPHQCPKSYDVQADFNYPSFSIPNLFLQSNPSITLTRRLKNVGSHGPITYSARLRQPRGVSISVHPPTLTFDKLGQEKTFTLTLIRTHHQNASSSTTFGELLWSDGDHHYVRSPIAIGSGNWPKLNDVSKQYVF